VQSKFGGKRLPAGLAPKSNKGHKKPTEANRMRAVPGRDLTIWNPRSANIERHGKGKGW
jgi:hypothetical protein